MIRFGTLAPLALTVAVATPALAQTSSTATHLSGVTVTAPAPTLPKVVSTFPEDGKSITPGVLILKVTFDQKMDPDGWDFGKGSDAYPDCLARPRLEPDQKTFVLLCTVGGQSRFSVTINSSGQGGFENGAGQKATPATVNFTTTDDKSLISIAEAMKAEGLKADEGPLMDVKPAAVAAAAPAPAPAP
jgi:hypothetical protein